MFFNYYVIGSHAPFGLDLFFDFAGYSLFALAFPRVEFVVRSISTNLSCRRFRKEVLESLLYEFIFLVSRDFVTMHGSVVIRKVF